MRDSRDCDHLSSSYSCSSTLMSTTSHQPLDRKGKTVDAKVDGDEGSPHIPPPVPVPTVQYEDGGKGIIPTDTDERDLEAGRTRPIKERPPDLTDRYGQPQDIYDKFSPGRKRVILAIVSYSAFSSRTCRVTTLTVFFSSCYIICLFTFNPSTVRRSEYLGISDQLQCRCIPSHYRYRTSYMVTVKWSLWTSTDISR